MLKAIETVYKGYRFRSRLEARWAVFFDALGIEWEYEKEGYDLGKLGYYLPDFWIPELEAWVEIKPTHPTRSEQAKMAALTQAKRGTLGIIRHSTPDPVANCGYGWWLGSYVGWQTFVQCLECGKIGSSTLIGPDQVPSNPEVKEEMVFHRLRCECKNDAANWLGAYTDTPLILAAFKTARQARFEHGEKPSHAERPSRVN